MLAAVAEAIAARAQPSGKGGNIVSLKNCQIQFVWGGHWSFATKIVGFEHRFFSYLQCLLKKIYLVTKLKVPSDTRLLKKKITGQKRGPTRWAHPLIRPWEYQCFTHWWRELRATPRKYQLHVEIVKKWPGLKLRQIKALWALVTKSLV